MIGRLYAATVGAQAQTAAKQLIEIASAADSVTILERAYISQSSFDTSENLAAKIQRVTTTGTGTALVPPPMQVGDSAFGGVVETDTTIGPTLEALSEQIMQGFNVLSGWLWTPANDDEVVVMSPSQLVGVFLDIAPSGSMDFHYGCTIREIGG